MNDQYIFTIVEADCSPPTGSQLHHGGGEYFFYPPKHDGDILTIDAMLWRESKPHASERQPVVSMWPDAEFVSECLARLATASNWTLIAVTQSSVGQTIDPDTSMVLTPLPELSQSFFDAGYDVVDISGLSALTNVGYTSHDASLLPQHPMKITVHGLITELRDAQEFAEFASKAAPEHAPFSPVKVLANRPTQSKALGSN